MFQTLYIADQRHRKHPSFSEGEIIKNGKTRMHLSIFPAQEGREEGRESRYGAFMYFLEPVAS